MRDAESDIILTAHWRRLTQFTIPNRSSAMVPLVHGSRRPQRLQLDQNVDLHTDIHQLVKLLRNMLVRWTRLSLRRQRGEWEMRWNVHAKVTLSLSVLR